MRTAALVSRLRHASPWRLIPLLAALLEVLWVYPWFAFISRWEALGWPNPPLTLASATVLAVAAEAVARFSLARRWSLGRARVVAIGALVLMVALVVRLDAGGGYPLWDAQWGQYALGHLSLLLGGLAFGAFLVWRGISIGREELSADDLHWKFTVGLVLLVVLLAVWGAASGAPQFGQVVASAGMYVVAYFSVGMLALGLAGLQSMREEMLRVEEASGLFHRRWLAMMLGLVLAIVLVAVGIASAFSFDLAALLLRPLNVLAGWLLTAFIYGVALPLGVVAAAVVYVLRFLVSLLRRGQEPVEFTPPDLSNLRRMAEEGEARGIPPEVVLALKWGLVALVALLVVLVLARALTRYWRGRPEEEIEETRESLWSWADFQADVRSLLARFLARFRRTRRTSPLAPAPPLAVLVEAEDQRLLSVREVYQGVLWEGRKTGLGRAPAETPHEYENKLLPRLGEAGVPALHGITEAYVDDRYGHLPPDTDRLLAVNSLWRQLRRLLQRTEAGEQRATKVDMQPITGKSARIDKPGE